VVNGPAPCDDDMNVRRSLAVLAVAATLAACSGEDGREFARYYDPRGLFITNLPEANDITVTPPSSGGEAPPLLTGVISTPPAPSPEPQSAFGGAAFDASQTEPPDQTVYRAFAITTAEFDDLDHMGLLLLTGQPSVDVQIDEGVRMDGLEARLLVADVVSNGAPVVSAAAAFTLGTDGTGYILIAEFPPGEWDAERDDFMRILESFRAEVPPGLNAFPVTGEQS
jgi:hypothetical protein